ncbi:MAG: hypothetical protein Q9218_007045, partial [Villophora microphyllina]
SPELRKVQLTKVCAEHFHPNFIHVNSELVHCYKVYTNLHILLIKSLQSTRDLDTVTDTTNKDMRPLAMFYRNVSMTHAKVKKVRKEMLPALEYTERWKTRDLEDCIQLGEGYEFETWYDEAKAFVQK